MISENFYLYCELHFSRKVFSDVIDFKLNSDVIDVKLNSDVTGD